MRKVVISQGKVWEFYTKDGFVECFNPYTLKYEKVNKCDGEEFDVTVKSNNLIFVLVKEKNNLFIMRYSDKWEKEAVLNSKDGNASLKNLTLIENAGWLNGFYIINDNNKNLLIHHIFPSEGKPKIIYASETPFFFCVTSDYKQNIYVLISEGRELCLRKYFWNTKTWDKEIKRNSVDYNIVNMNFIVDGEEKPHICYCGEKGDKYFVVAGENVLMRDLIKPAYPLLSFLNSELVCMFNYYGKLLQSTCVNKTFQKLKYFHVNGFRECNKAKLSSSVEFTEQRNFVYTYGFINKEGVFCDATLTEDEYKQIILETNKQRNEMNVELFGEKNTLRQ